MKKASEYIDKAIVFNEPSLISKNSSYADDIKNIIKQAQKDAIEYALKVAAGIADTVEAISDDDIQDFSAIENGMGDVYIVDRSSILLLKDKLFKELDND